MQKWKYGHHWRQNSVTFIKFHCLVWSADFTDVLKKSNSLPISNSFFLCRSRKQDGKHPFCFRKIVEHRL